MSTKTWNSEICWRTPCSCLGSSLLLSRSAWARILSTSALVYVVFPTYAAVPGSTWQPVSATRVSAPAATTTDSRRRDMLLPPDDATAIVRNCLTPPDLARNGGRFPVPRGPSSAVVEPVAHDVRVSGI